MPSVAAAQGLLPAPVPEVPVAVRNYLDQAKRVVDAAAQPAAPWNGPRDGPRAQRAKRIAVVAEDLRNGGILGVVDGVLEAARVVGWSVKIFDTGGTPEGG
jgi:ribose transport system substrate-binding protein